MVSSLFLFEMGGVRPEKVFAWANRHERFKQVTNDEQMLQNAFEAVMKRAEKISGTEYFTRKVCDEGIQIGFAINFARCAVQAYFDGKNDEELYVETLDNEMWVKEVEADTIEGNFNALLMTLVTVSELGHINLLTKMSYGDDSDTDDDCSRTMSETTMKKSKVQ